VGTYSQASTACSVRVAGFDREGAMLRIKVRHVVVEIDLNCLLRWALFAVWFSHQ
jgi:hypothetical protein